MQNLPLQCRTHFQCLRMLITFQDKKVRESEEPAKRQHLRVQQPAEGRKLENKKHCIDCILSFDLLHFTCTFPSFSCMVLSIWQQVLASCVHILGGSKHVYIIPDIFTQKVGKCSKPKCANEWPCMTECSTPQAFYINILLDEEFSHQKHFAPNICTRAGMLLKDL